MWPGRGFPPRGGIYLFFDGGENIERLNKKLYFLTQKTNKISSFQKQGGIKMATQESPWGHRKFREAFEIQKAVLEDGVVYLKFGTENGALLALNGLIACIVDDNYKDIGHKKLTKLCIASFQNKLALYFGEEFQDQISTIKLLRINRYPKRDLTYTKAINL